MATILADDNFKCIFLNDNDRITIQISLNLFPGVQLTTSQPWFRKWLGTEESTSHYLNQNWSSSLSHIRDTRKRWVNSSGDRKYKDLMMIEDYNNLAVLVDHINGFVQDCSISSSLTHWGQDKMAAMFQRIFLNKNLRSSIEISLKFICKVRFNIIPALVQMMAWRRPGDKPWSELMMASLLLIYTDPVYDILMIADVLAQHRQPTW